uniref:UBA domain-containing protein n=1 Tax=Dunaliella tertiolecta TaxID=3047 RepID=A0A7S3R2M0_DUNTE
MATYSPHKPTANLQQHNSSSAHHNQAQPHPTAHGVNGGGSSSRSMGRAVKPGGVDSMATIEIDLTNDFPRIVRRRVGEESSKQQQQQGPKVGSHTRLAQQPIPPPSDNTNQQHASAGGPKQRAPHAQSVTLQVLDHDDDDRDIQVVDVRQLPPPPSVPPLEENLALANLETGLNLCMPPPHWHPTDTMLRGNVTFVELPLPGGAPQSSQVAAGLAELQSNGLSVAEARVALAAAGNDSRRALARLVEERILEPEAVDMLVANAGERRRRQGPDAVH